MRRRRALAAMAARGLDALLLFKQESMYWLTGYDTFGYCFFQCLVLRADGDLVLLTRAPDLRQAQHTSIIEDVRIWVDREGSNPAAELRDLLAEKGLAGKRLGVEYETHGLTAANGRRLDAALDGFADDGRRLGPDRPPAPGEVRSRARLCAPRRGTGRCRARCGDRGDPGRRRRGRDPRRHARRDLPGRRRLPGQPVHHRLRARRPALPLQVGAPPARRQRPADPRVRRRLPPVPRLPDAHAPGRRAERPPARAARRLPRGAARLRGEAHSRHADGRGVRRPCRGVRPPRPRARTG